MKERTVSIPGFSVVRGSENEYVAELEALIESTELNTPEERHNFSRTLMTRPRFIKGLAITLARRFHTRNIRPSHVLGFEKWTGNPVGFIVAEWLSGSERDGTDVALAAAGRRKPFGDSVSVEFKPSRFGSPLTAHLLWEAIREKSRVLIIDDLIDSGATTVALQHLAREVNANVIGIGALIARREGYEKILAATDKSIPVEVLTLIE